MRILFAIPHFFARKADGTGRAGVRHGSTSSDPDTRRAAISRCVLTLHQHLGAAQSMIHIAQRRTQPANSSRRAQIHVVVCTAGDQHLLNRLALDRSLYQHLPTDCEPALLGFQCHTVLRDRWGNYDFYCYLEDDLILHDPWHFAKLAWFNESLGPNDLLQPNRYERGPGPRDLKVYVDGDLSPKMTAAFQDVSQQPKVESRVMGQKVVFQRTLNPHSGCFFLNSQQMQHWLNQPYFLDRDTSFVGPLESAATLGVMRTFKIYKPAPEFAAFLEIEHHGRQFSRLIRYSS
jgi:hypothetical protein